MIAFCSAVQTSTELRYCFLLGVWTLGRFQNRTCIVSNHHMSRPERKKKFIMIDSYEEMGAAIINS